MKEIISKYKERLRKSIEWERRFDRPLESFARILWPYSDLKLIFYVSALAALDYVSTFAALELSGNNVSEVGILAKWALDTGGFVKLLIVDVAVIGILISIALISRWLYLRIGLKGFARAAFALVLLPYLVFIMGVIINNVIVVFI
jgi:hypothetical protein